MVFTKNVRPALDLAKGITLNFVRGLMAFTKNLRPASGFSQGHNLKPGFKITITSQESSVMN